MSTAWQPEMDHLRRRVEELEKMVCQGHPAGVACGICRPEPEIECCGRGPACGACDDPEPVPQCGATFNEHRCTLDKDHEGWHQEWVERLVDTATWQDAPEVPEWRALVDEYAADDVPPQMARAGSASRSGWTVPTRSGRTALMSECRCACGMEILPGRDWTVHADACGCVTNDADMQHEYDRCFITRGVERDTDE